MDENLHKQRGLLVSLIQSSSLPASHKAGFIRIADHFTQWEDMKGGVISMMGDTLDVVRSQKTFLEIRRLISEIGRLA